MPSQSDRPTIPPSFDVQQYAKDSDARLAAVPAASASEQDAGALPQSEMRLLTRPKLGAAITDEAWARAVSGTPAVVMADQDLKRLPLDHRAGFLLSLMDGTVDLDTLAEIAAMPREEVLRVVRDLFESGVVDFR
jgi:hypothetical protein